MKGLTMALEVDKIDPRTIRKDMETLQDTGFDIVENRRAHGQIYYSHQAKMFETYELRTLVDAILSARFITKREKGELIDKIKQLASVHVRKTLPEPVLFHQSVNMNYHMIKLNIDRVHEAITHQAVLKYRYGDYTVEKNFELRRDGGFYYVEPYALIWQNDLYYLIARFQETDELRHYRLDRMREIEKTELRFKRDKSFELQSYVDNSFHMFSGDESRIKIRFRRSLLNAIYDRFGLEADVVQDGEDAFTLTTQAKVSDGLLGWILQWGRGAEVLSPASLKEQVQLEIAAMHHQYN